MSKILIHSVFRSYIALARAETFSPSEIGASKDFYGAVTGRLIGSFSLCQVNYYADEAIEAAIEKFWKKDSEQIFKNGVIANPGKLANRLICRKLEKNFGWLNGNIPQFNENGLLDIPRLCDFIVPKREGNLINKFLFFRINGRIEKI